MTFTFTSDDYRPCPKCDRPIKPGDRITYAGPDSTPVHASDVELIDDDG